MFDSNLRSKRYLKGIFAEYLCVVSCFFTLDGELIEWKVNNNEFVDDANSVEQLRKFFGLVVTGSEEKTLNKREITECFVFPNRVETHDCHIMMEQ